LFLQIFFGCYCSFSSSWHSVFAAYCSSEFLNLWVWSTFFLVRNLIKIWSHIPFFLGKLIKFQNFKNKIYCHIFTWNLVWGYSSKQSSTFWTSSRYMSSFNATFLFRCFNWCNIRKLKKISKQRTLGRKYIYKPMSPYIHIAAHGKHGCVYKLVTCQMNVSHQTYNSMNYYCCVEL
jgi:hypothetical protein